jgi:hypothetical protein
MYKIAFSNLRWATGLTSFNRSALEEAIDSGHVARLAARYGEALPSKREDYIDSLEIQSISPQTLMNKYGLRKIDWVQIDAEGFDFEIIKMLSIDKLQPKVIVYEKSHLSSHDQQACLSLLHGNNYVTSDISENTIALKRPVGVLGRFFPDA